MKDKDLEVVERFFIITGGIFWFVVAFATVMFAIAYILHLFIYHL